MPLISVAMGVLCPAERTELLHRAVDSVLGQTHAEFELLICDDGSARDPRALLERFQQQDARVRLLRPGDKLSLPEKLNACLAAARGDFIARMDDDDWARPDRFARQLEWLGTHPELAFAGSNVTLVRGGMQVGQRRLPEFPCVRDFYFVQPFIHPALLFRREALEQVGGYSEDKSCLLCEDYDLLLRLYAQGLRGGNLQEPLLEYTIPATAKGTRRFPHRWNETVTRYRRFRELGALPGAWPYVVKPLAVGLVPEPLLRKWKGQ